MKNRTDMSATPQSVRCARCPGEARCERLLSGEHVDSTFCIGARIPGDSSAGSPPRPFPPGFLGMVMPAR
ncbi:MAG: hypothetical protein O2780_21310 [Proteobacteria bacterium]|nr:hypothetical protein [Pseudomonadota bacterium]